MILPRWTVYPALVTLAATLVIAIPSSNDEDPFEGAAVREATALRTLESNPSPGPFEHKPLVVLGIDGMDPDILAETIELFPDDMKNFRWLIEAGDGIQSLGTSCPPQSPVAWSNFITGMDPGGHGIFDFIHRDLMTRGPLGSTTVSAHPSEVPLWGDWQIQLGGDSPSNRTGRAFWQRLMDHGVPADIWRMPINFPVEESRGVSFPGMLTPALDSAYGQCTFFTTDPAHAAAIDYEKVERVDEWDGQINARLVGPANPFKKKNKAETAAFTVYVDRENGAAIFDVGAKKVVLRPGQWSAFVPLEFELLPLGAMNMSGICRFYLRSIDPEVEFYVSPVNFDPTNPAVPVSMPESASAELAEAIGLYYTQGMAEDVNALKYEVLTDAEFMQQVELVYRERRKMLDHAIDVYLADKDGGLLFFYFSTVDLGCHMMWRHHDASHPAHDDAIAKQDSSRWSGREGSTWKDTVYDLYRKMDPVLGRLRERLGDDVALIVMSDHGFAPYRREFDLNRWLWEEGYLVLKDGFEPESEEKPSDSDKVYIFGGGVDWEKTKAYGMGFNGLYLNLQGRELDNPETPENEAGIVAQGSEAERLLKEIGDKLERLVDPVTGLKPVLSCDFATDVYHGARVPEAPDLLVGYNAGYGNSDPASTGRITHTVLADNTGGTFNGSHLMAPEVVSGVLLTNRPVREGQHKLEDLTVEVLKHYGIAKPDELRGHPVLE